MTDIIDFDIIINEIHKNRTLTYQIVGNSLRSICNKFIFQLEEDIESNVKFFRVNCQYIDGTTQLNALQLLTNVLNILDTKDYPCIRPLYNIFNYHNFSYNMATGIIIDGPWKDIDFTDDIKYVNRLNYIQDITYDKLYPFQKSLYDMSKEYDPQTIDIIQSSSHNNGNTLISNYLVNHNNCHIIPNYKNYQMILLDAYRHAIYLKTQYGDGIDSKCRNINAYIIDLSESNFMITKSFIYAVESIKKGMLLDCRYSYKIHRIKQPRIFIFCNRIPELSFFSMNIIKLWKIENKELVSSS